MLTLTLASLRRRPTRYLASFVAVLLGATMVMAFGSLLDTAGAQPVSAQSRDTLETMALVVGGWGQLLVVFAVTSTLGLAVRQRARELALLKNVGATPRQIGAMVVGEAFVVSLLAAALAVPFALPLGGWILDLLIDSGQVDEALSHSVGPVALGQGVGGSVLMAVVAALLTARRATGLTAASALADAQYDTGRTGRARAVAAALFLLVGTGLAVTTATALRDEGADAQAAAGPAVIAVSVGLALLAPALTRFGAALLGRPLSLLCGAAGQLAVCGVRHRIRRLSAAVLPIVLFTGVGTGTLGMQVVENAAIADEGVLKPVDQRNLETLNLVVIGIVAAFCCVMLINTLVSLTTFRAREFGQQRLAGATPRQVRTAVGAEAAVLSLVGVAAGAFAGLFALIPYSVSRTGSAVPNSAAVPWIWLGVTGFATLLTFAASWGTARRVLRRSTATEAVLAA
ncbi:FtsX-like permease family protein [Streptomyces sp. AJS327]|uniref:ABC transporter permease n=1 Tax=Streptomyces sp. AJS327 TaxID=2545265 RepID=UPI0015DFC614|nr:ABC transporter permease [Streptomyces sp. AJS327]MBA0051380.1 FtsX-like permease family protein [Streptomyces sp. AJS327]